MAYQIKLPFKKSSEYGHQHITETIESIKQDFKSLILTEEGESPSDPAFGTKIRESIFEYDSPLVRQNIRSEIETKAKKYLPFVTVKDITFNLVNDILLIKVTFFVGNSSIVQELESSFKTA